MIWLADLVPPPHTRHPLTTTSFFHDLLPPLLLYYTTALLTLIPDTQSTRLVILPFTLLSTFRAATKLDLVIKYNDERLIYLNQGLLLALTTLSMRAIAWAFCKQPFKRVKVIRPACYAFDEKDYSEPKGLLELAVNAFDLCANLRGCGWSWSNGLRIPHETRPTDSAVAFVFATISSLFCHIIAFDTLHYAVQSFSPLTIGSAKGGTIFNATSPAVQRYMCSSTITLLSGFTVYCAIQVGYHLCTLFGVVLFRQHSSLWPPAFNSPWLATSLAEFWAVRWHQIFRDNFISLGSIPLSLLFGRVGNVLGAFLVSGVLHDFGLWGMGNGADFMYVGGFFIMMGIGVIIERIWYILTDRRVGGPLGRVWTMIWIVGWGNILIDAWARKGLIGSVFFPAFLRPTNYIFGPLA